MTWRASSSVMMVALIAAALAACADTARLDLTSESERLEQQPAAELTGDRFERQILVTIENEPGLDLRSAGSTPRGYFSPGAYQAGPDARQIAGQLEREYGLTRLDAWPIRALRVHCVVYGIPGGVSRAALLERLTRDPRVESAQPLQAFHVLGGEYNDPYWKLQHANEALGIRDAHRWASGRGVRVGIVDTGIDLHHQELDGRVIASADFVGDDRQRFVTDRHGTAVAGIIAASVNNRLGIVGVAPEAVIVAAKACWYTADPEPAAAVCSSFTLARALAYMLERGIDVLNLSLTGPRDALLERLVAAAVAAGVVVVAARPDDQRAPAFPAGVRDVIAVRAFESADPGEPEADALYAPGDEILSLTPDDRYDYFSGSSVAAAHVSGIAALLRERRPGIGSDVVREVLVRTAVPISADPLPGRPLVNACVALADLLGSGECMTAKSQAAALIRPVL